MITREKEERTFLSKENIQKMIKVMKMKWNLLMIMSRIIRNKMALYRSRSIDQVEKEKLK
jgi:hypothetical protein